MELTKSQHWARNISNNLKNSFDRLALIEHALASRYFKLVMSVIIALILLSGFSYSQTIKPIHKCYSVKTYSQDHNVITYNVYYIISDRIVLINGKTYNEFTFSSDSLNTCGYIRYDSLARQIYFLSKYYNDPKFDCDSTHGEQKLFSFFNNYTKVCYGGELGTVEIYSQVRPDSNSYVMSLFTDIHSSDTIEIEQLFFSSFLYPDKIVIHDPFLLGYYTINAK